MKFHTYILALGVVAVMGASHASGQTLGDLARQEAARRQSVAKGKVITNDDLKPAPPPSPGTVPPATAPGTTLPPPPAADKTDASTAAKPGEAKPVEATPAAPAAATGAKDEKYWRDRVTATRDKLARSQTFQDALQARIAALSTDFTNRDDPAQRNQIATERQRALAELERVKAEIKQYQTDLTTIADEARRAGAPAGWVR